MTHKDFVESELLSTMEESLVNTVREGVEAFAAEIVENIATTELGVATTGSLSPVIPELVAAQKLADIINAIL